MTRFLLIRHATNPMVGKRLTGQTTGIHLNEEGQNQAHQLAERMAHISLHAIYSSPLERAVETAQPIAALHDLKISCLDEFIEIDVGEWTNCSIEELKSNVQFQLFNSFRSCTRIPGGESMLEVQTRMITGLEKLRMQHSQQTVAVVGHGDLIKAAVAYYAGIHLDMFQRIEISPASVSIVEIYDETARILLLNDTGDLQVS